MHSSTQSLLKLILLSCSFLLVFLAFNGTQTIMSSLTGQIGYWSLSCIYISFMTCALFLSTGVVLTITPKWSIFLGSIIYAAFIAANLRPMWYTLVPLAVLLGLAASILWSGEGAYVTAAAIAHATSLGRPFRSSVGLFNGIFFGIFQLSMLIGNILCSLILRRGDNSTVSSSDSSSSSDSGNGNHGLNPRAQMLFYCYVAICCTGIVGLLTLPHPNSPKEKEQQSQSSGSPTTGDKKSGSGLKKMAGALVLLKDPKMFLFIPFLIFTGIEQAFIFGDFTKNYVTDVHGIGMVGFVMSVFGVTDSLGSVLLGRIADKVGPRWIALFGIIVFGSFLPWIGFTRDGAFGKTLAAAFIWSGVLGIADAAIFSVFCNAALSTLFHDKTEAAFSNLKVFQAMGTAFSFFMGPILTFNIKLYVLAGTLIVGSIGVFILDRFVQPLTAIKANSSTPTTTEEPTIQHKETIPLISGK